MGEYALLIDYKYCTGCHVCEVSCRKEHDIPLDEWGIKLSQMGPVKMRGEWLWDYVPVPSDLCDLCEDRVAQGKKPRVRPPLPGAMHGARARGGAFCRHGRSRQEGHLLHPVGPRTQAAWPAVGPVPAAGHSRQRWRSGVPGAALLALRPRPSRLAPSPPALASGSVVHQLRLPGERGVGRAPSARPGGMPRPSLILHRSDQGPFDEAPPHQEALSPPFLSFADLLLVYLGHPSAKFC